MDKSQVERIKISCDIVSVISEYVHLKKKGRSFWGLCPFHNEKTPSFHVDPDRQIYRCFGCSRGGDVINFLMEKKGLSFAETVTELSIRAGIPLEPARNSRASSENKVYYTANKAAMLFFEEQLQSREGEAARKYLAGRGLSEETIRSFHIGFAPDSWNSLGNFLGRKGISGAAAEKCGLLAERKGGSGYYDRFRNRVMFPIIDLSGEVIGFGGRIMDAGEPKYLNSPESPIFEKRKVLYNLHSARSSIRSGGAVVVEGYMDVVSLANAGFPAATATLGTALGEDHVRLLRRFTDDITLVFDGDAAGRSAMVRALEPFLSSDVIPKVVILPPGKDPDDIAREGLEVWTEFLANPQDIWNFIFDESFSRRDPSKLRDQNTIIRELMPMVSRVGDQVIRDLLVQKLAVRIGVSPEVVAGRINLESKGSGGEGAVPEPSSGSERDMLEETLVRLMLFDTEAIDAVRDLQISVDFHKKNLMSVFSRLMEHGTGSFDHQSCPDEVRSAAQKLMAQGEFPGDGKKALIDTIYKFKRLAIEEEIRKIQSDLNEAELTQNKQRRNEMLRLKQEKLIQVRNLRSFVMEALERR
jgi:DNA primase